MKDAVFLCHLLMLPRATFPINITLYSVVTNDIWQDNPFCSTTLVRDGWQLQPIFMSAHKCNFMVLNALAFTTVERGYSLRVMHYRRIVLQDWHQVSVP